MKCDLTVQSLSSVTFGNLSGVPGLVHGVFTRHGGVSLPPYDSLNVSWSNGDSPEAVLENLTRIKNAAGLERLVSSRQFHGDSVNFIGKESVRGLEERPPALVAARRFSFALPFSVTALQQTDVMSYLKHIYATTCAQIRHKWSEFR